MKILGLLTLFTAACFFSCKKNNDAQPGKLDLQNNLSFKGFVARSLVQKMKLVTVTNNGLSLAQRTQLLKDVSSVESTQENIQAVYAKYSIGTLPLNTLVLTNIAEELRLLENVPELKSLSEAELQTTLANNYRVVAADLLEKAKVVVKARLTATPSTGPGESYLSKKVYDVGSLSMIGDLDFETLYNSIPSSMTDGEISTIVEEGLYDFAVTNQVNGITLEEVLNCAKEAFLYLIGSITGIVQLGKLIEVEGIGAGIKLVSKFIIKNAGWVTAAILAADMGLCLYNAAQN